MSERATSSSLRRGVGMTLSAAALCALFAGVFGACGGGGGGGGGNGNNGGNGLPDAGPLINDAGTLVVNLDGGSYPQLSDDLVRVVDAVNLIYDLGELLSVTVADALDRAAQPADQDPDLAELVRRSNCVDAQTGAGSTVTITFAQGCTISGGLLPVAGELVLTVEGLGADRSLALSFTSDQLLVRGRTLGFQMRVTLDRRSATRNHEFSITNVNTSIGGVSVGLTYSGSFGFDDTARNSSGNLGISLPDNAQSVATLTDLRKRVADLYPHGGQISVTQGSFGMETVTNLQFADQTPTTGVVVWAQGGGVRALRQLPILGQ